MNRADLMEHALRDGNWHSRREIQDAVGYFLTNNAASELRARGVTVEHKRDGRLDLYRLTPSSSPAGAGQSPPLMLAPAPQDSATDPSDTSGTDEHGVAVASDSAASVAEQLPLYREPRRGAYAA